MSMRQKYNGLDCVLFCVTQPTHEWPSIWKGLFFEVAFPKKMSLKSFGQEYL